MPRPATRTRLAGTWLAPLVRRSPVVAVLGARGTGKTTLVRGAFPGFGYVDLDDPAGRERVARDPAAALSPHERLILDEVQRLPQMLPALRAFLEGGAQRRVILVGSVSPHFFRRVSEPLAGLVAVFEPGGLSVLEEEAEALWIEGAFPGIHRVRPKPSPGEWHAAHVRGCLEWDFARIGLRAAPDRLRTLLALVAYGQGGLFNPGQLGAAMGLDFAGAALTLDALEGLGLVRQVPAWVPEIDRRVVRSPKAYVRDSGMLHGLLSIPFAKRAVVRHAKAGASFETFCIEQVALHAALADPAAQVFHFRILSGPQIGLLLRFRGRLTPIAIDAAARPPDAADLEACMKALGLRRGFVVTPAAGSREIRRGIRLCGPRELLEEIGCVPPARAPRARPAEVPRRKAAVRPAGRST